VLGPTDLSDGCFMSPVPSRNIPLSEAPTAETAAAVISGTTTASAAAAALTAASLRVDLALAEANSSDLRGVNLSSGKILGLSKNGCEALALRADGVLLHFQLGDSLKALAGDRSSAEPGGSSSQNSCPARPKELLRVPSESSAFGAIVSPPTSRGAGSSQPLLVDAPLAAIAVHFNPVSAGNGAATVEHASQLADGGGGNARGNEQVFTVPDEGNNDEAFVCCGLLKVQALPPDPSAAARAAEEASAHTSNSAISTSPERRAALLAKRRAQWAMEKNLKEANEIAVTGLKAFADVAMHMEETLATQQHHPAGLSTLPNWSGGGSGCWMCAHPGPQHWDQPGMASSSKSKSKSKSSNSSRGGALVKSSPPVAITSTVGANPKHRSNEQLSTSTGAKSRAKATKRPKVASSTHGRNQAKSSRSRGDGLSDNDDNDEGDEDVVEFISRVSDAKPCNEESATARVQQRLYTNSDPMSETLSTQPNAKRTLALPEVEPGKDAYSVMPKVAKTEEAAVLTVVKIPAAEEEVAAVLTTSAEVEMAAEKTAEKTAEAAETAQVDKKAAAAAKEKRKAAKAAKKAERAKEMAAARAEGEMMRAEEEVREVAARAAEAEKVAAEKVLLAETAEKAAAEVALNQAVAEKAAAEYAMKKVMAADSLEDMKAIAMAAQSIITVKTVKTAVAAAPAMGPASVLGQKHPADSLFNSPCSSARAATSLLPMSSSTSSSSAVPASSAAKPPFNAADAATPVDAAATSASSASLSTSLSSSPSPRTAREEALMAENALLLAEKASMVEDMARMNVARERQFQAKKLLRKVALEKEAKLQAR